MSTLSVLLYAGVTTLTAAIVTLFTAGMAAGSMERRSRKRRYRQMEDPVPGRRGLSDVAPARDGSTLDVFAGLDEAEMAATGLDDDLNGIDGGRLPASTVKTPQKSRR